MNPFDAMNSNTVKNRDKSKKSFNKSPYEHANDSKSNLSTMKKRFTLSDSEVQKLKHKYSTARLNLYDIVRLKVIQSVINKRSRSDLIDDMIKVSKPVYLSTSAKRTKYNKLLKYALEGLKINNQFK